MQKHRIYTDIGKDQKITLEIKQDYDLLEILSLKFSQKDIYSSFCADYGVVCGRISVNNGFGIPNAKISIFVPLSTDDENDPVISSLYPYKSTDQRDENNYRYNLLPSRQQHGGHVPTGTFPDQRDVLTREEVLEVYEKYYKYTVKTNTAGDFMIWGVPLGSQILHVDVDLSDIGCFSLRPYDFIRQGSGVDSFQNKYTFKGSEDIDSLPQIVSFDKTIEVYPFWGNQDLCEIGITRTDFDLSSQGVKIEPKAFLIGGTYTDTGKNAVNKNCDARTKMGRKCDLTTKTGTIEAIRFTSTKDENYRPILEKFELHEDIPEDGSFVVPLPMNMEYIITNEFGENEITNDPNKGIPTAACYRFRFTLNDSGNSRIRKNASYLAPNIREYSTDINKSYSFSTDYNDYPSLAINSLILDNTDGQFYPKDYFYRFQYNKVYTVSSFQSLYSQNSTFERDKYVGIKEIVPSEEEDCSSDVVTPPVNFGVKNKTFQLLIADVLLFFEHLINLIVLTFINTVTIVFHDFADAVDFHPIKFLAKAVRKFAYRIQSGGQKKLYLISYPECEECNGEDSFGAETQNTEILNFCPVASGQTYGSNDQTIFTSGITGASSSWVINHGLGELNPIVQVIDGTNTTITPTNIVYTDVNNLTINFGSAVTGTTIITLSNQSYRIRPMVGSIDYTTVTGGTGCTLNTRIANDADLVAKQYYPPPSLSSGYYLRYTGITTSATTIVELNTEPNGDHFEIQNGQLVFIDYSNIFTPQATYTFEIVDKWQPSGSTGTTLTLESGCELFDCPYDEDLVKYYYEGTGSSRTVVSGCTALVTATNLSNRDEHLVTSYKGENFPRDTDSGETEFANGVFYFVPATQTNKKLWSILKEYRRRKRVCKLFCGGIVNFSFIDNWLSGSLYFFQFKSKKNKYCSDVIHKDTDDRYYYRSTSYVDATNTWGIDRGDVTLLNRPTTFVDLGPRDEFIKEICIDQSLDPNCSVSRSIGPTSFQSFGELLGLAINYRMDVSNNLFDINNFFDNSGFTVTNRVFDGDITQLISINNEVGIAEFDLQDPKYLGYSYQVLDPDTYPQLFKPHGYWGPLPVTFVLDEDGQRIRACINEPTHIDYYGNPVEGRLTEASQPVPFFLWDKKGTGFGGTDENTSDDQSWDYSTVVVQPLQGMTTGYTITGIPNDSSDKYLLLPITETFSGLTITGNVTNEVHYDAISLTDDHLNYDTEYPGFVFLHVTGGTTTTPTAGVLYARYGAAGNWWSTYWDINIDFILHRTEDYWGRRQILSTPFMFYFGLKAGKTGIDKFIDLFGPKGAFPSAE
jgi:hypothetical protein